MTEPPKPDDVSWIVGVLGHAAGCSAAQFVPVPFLDDFAVSILFARIAEKVLARHGGAEPGYAKQIAKGYLDEGGSSIGTWVLVTAAKFVLRKVAIVFDVKKSHDVFGEAVAFALALDVAMEQKTLLRAAPRGLGAAIFRSVRSVGRAPLGAIASAAVKTYRAGSEEKKLETFQREVADQARATRVELRTAFTREAVAPPAR